MGTPRLMDPVRSILRVHHYHLRTEQSYLHWIKRYILFHGKRHPREMGQIEIGAFLSHLAEKKNVSASIQNQALAAILFHYKKVLNIEPEWIEGVVRAKRPRRLPVVLKRDVVMKLLDQLNGTEILLAYLICAVSDNRMTANNAGG